jgi:hypothetical protein
VVGKTIDITIDAEAILDGPVDGARGTANLEDGASAAKQRPSTRQGV